MSVRHDHRLVIVKRHSVLIFATPPQRQAFHVRTTVRRALPLSFVLFVFRGGRQCSPVLFRRRLCSIFQNKLCFVGDCVPMTHVHVKHFRKHYCYSISCSRSSNSSLSGDVSPSALSIGINCSSLVALDGERCLYLKERSAHKCATHSVWVLCCVLVHTYRKQLTFNSLYRRSYTYIPSYSKTQHHQQPKPNVPQYAGSVQGYHPLPPSRCPAHVSFEFSSSTLFIDHSGWRPSVITPTPD